MAGILADSTTGTLAAAVAGTFDIPTKGFSRLSITLKNTGGSNAIGTNALLISQDGSTFVEVTPIGTSIGSLSAGASKSIDLGNLTAHTVRVSLTSASGSTYSAQWRGSQAPIEGSLEAKVDGTAVGSESTTGNFSATNITAGGTLTVTGTTTCAAVNASAACAVSIDDATTNASTVCATLRHTTSGTAAANIGAGLLFASEDASGNAESVAQIDGILTTATHSSEASAVVVKTRTAGGALTEAWRVDGSGNATAVGDLAAAGGFRQAIGPFFVTTAADQTAVGTKLGDTVAMTWVAPRAGSVTAAVGMLDTAITGGGTTITARVYKNGSLLNAAYDLAFTQAGGEVKAYATVAKDTYTFAAGDEIDVVYTSTTITNTPKMVVFVEVEC